MQAKFTCRECGGGRMPTRPICITCHRSQPLAVRFWRYVNRSGDCWLWTGATNGKYGKIGRGKNLGTVGAHRAAWEIHFGPIPEGIYVCHLCDVPLCVRPSHLTLGTPAANNMDKIAKGRANVPTGDKHWRGKLTSMQVQEIRALAESGLLQREIAARFGINRVTVSRIARGESRKAG
jgi:hypothetical protein